MTPERVLDSRELVLEASSRNLKQCGLFLADGFFQGHDLILDMDGVVVKADSLTRPEITTPRIITSIKLLEKLGVKVGAATARGEQILDYLRGEHGLQMAGPAILEEGQVIIINGNKEYLTRPNHTKFIADARRFFRLPSNFRSSWLEVRMLAKLSGQGSLCPGDFQWQGECRSSYWFPSQIKDRELLKVFNPVLRELAKKHELDFESDLVISVNRMPSVNLGILSIKGKRDGLVINKGTAAERLTLPWIFVADGFGDVPLALVTKRIKGGVIGVEGNLDDSKEPGEFLRNADFVFNDPAELAQVLFLAASFLKEYQCY